MKNDKKHNISVNTNKELIGDTRASRETYGRKHNGGIGIGLIPILSRITWANPLPKITLPKQTAKKQPIKER